MTDFRPMSAAQAQDVLAGLGPRARRKAIQGLIYRKGTRPAALSDQLVLLRALADAPVLRPFDRTYALIACAHKALESVDTDMLSALGPRLDEAWAFAATLPQRDVLRMDGLHMRFSVLNVAINRALLLDDPGLPALCRAAIAALNALVPRRASPYLFNSSSNIIKTVGLALALDPAQIPHMADQVGRLIFLSLKPRHAHEVLEPILRRFGPSRLEDVEPDTPFSEFEETFERYRLLRALKVETDPAHRDAALLALGRSCIGQRTEAQRSALQAALDRALATNRTAPL